MANGNQPRTINLGRQYAERVLRNPTARPSAVAEAQRIINQGQQQTKPPAEGGETTRVLRDVKREPTALDLAEKQLTDIVTKPPAAVPSLDEIREERRRSSQGIIDTINSKFEAILAEEREAGKVREARTRASNVSAGLTGSDFASSAAAKTEEANRKIIRAIEQERAAEINAVLSGIDNAAREEHQTRTQRARQSAEESLKQVQAFRDRAKQNAASLAGSGVTFSEFQEQEPERFQKLLEQTGLSEAGLKALFVNNQPEENKLGQTTVGNKTIFFFRDPVTGETRQEEFEIPVEAGTRVSGITVDSDTGQAVIKEIVTDAQGNETARIRVADLTEQGFETPAPDPEDVTFDQFVAEAKGSLGFGKESLDPNNLLSLFNEFRRENNLPPVTETGRELTDFTREQKLKLEQAGLSNAGRQEQLDFLFTDTGRTP